MKLLHVETDFGKRVDTDMFLMPIIEIVSRYEHRCKYDVSIHCYMSRVFNDRFELVSRPRKYWKLKLADVTIKDKQIRGIFLDVTELANTLSIPDRYVLELLAISFVHEQGEVTIFPSETKVDAMTGIRDGVEKEIKVLREIGGTFEATVFLRNIGLPEVAEELGKGHARFQQGDYPESVNAYRKVVEGLRNHIQGKPTANGQEAGNKILIDQSENRTEKIIGLLNKTYGLLSDFGEHYGTKALDEEGTFARRIIDSMCEYLLSKLRK